MSYGVAKWCKNNGLKYKRIVHWHRRCLNSLASYVVKTKTLSTPTLRLHQNLQDLRLQNLWILPKFFKKTSPLPSYIFLNFWYFSVLIVSYLQIQQKKLVELQQFYSTHILAILKDSRLEIDRYGFFEANNRYIQKF